MVEVVLRVGVVTLGPVRLLVASIVVVVEISVATVHGVQVVISCSVSVVIGWLVFVTAVVVSATLVVVELDRKSVV